LAMRTMPCFANTDDFSTFARQCLLEHHDVPDQESFPLAAVLVPLLQRRQGLHVLLTVRAPWLKRHAGQVAFPGGRIEPSDASPLAAAARELEEEVAVPASCVEGLGHLSSRISISDFRVVPVVGLVHGDIVPMPDQREVVEVFEVPLDQLLSVEDYQLEERVIDGIMRRTYAIERGGHRIWGLTGWILRDLAVRLAHGGAQI
jgi:8-oxo-dGTP pyrophosphatase MutT (NUDIX family)